MTKDEIQQKLTLLKAKRDDIQSLVNIHHNMQLALKTLLNSLYGALGNEWFKFFNFYNAEAITSTGQYAIQCNTHAVNDYVNKLTKTNKQHAIYNDTDSISISLESVIEYVKVDRNSEGYIDALCNFADNALNKQTAIASKKIADSLNFFENKLSFKREKIFLSGLYVIKKRYALLVIDEEGVRFKNPKLKITGLETKRSDTSRLCRDALKDVIIKILTEDEQSVQKYISDFREVFNNSAPEIIARPKSVSDLEKYYDPVKLVKPKCPMQVRAAIVYNKFLTDNGLENVYNKIDDGAKIKFVTLKLPNPVKQNVIGFMSKLPTEIDFASFIDYNEMYEDTFFNAADRMVQCAGWKSVYSPDVEDTWF